MAHCGWVNAIRCLLVTKEVSLRGRQTTRLTMPAFQPHKQIETRWTELPSLIITSSFSVLNPSTLSLVSPKSSSDAAAAGLCTLMQFGGPPNSTPLNCCTMCWHLQPMLRGQWNVPRSTLWPPMAAFATPSRPNVLHWQGGQHSGSVLSSRHRHRIPLGIPAPPAGG